MLKSLLLLTLSSGPLPCVEVQIGAQPQGDTWKRGRRHHQPASPLSTTSSESTNQQPNATKTSIATMLRSAARQYVSAQRPGWSRSGVGVISSSSPPPHHKDKVNFVTNTKYGFPMRRSMSSSTPPNSSSWGGFSFTLPGFGSRPITPQIIDAEETAATTVSSVVTNNTSSSIAAAAEQIAASASSAVFEPTWWPSDQALVFLNWVNENAGFPCYAYAICATTLAFRAALLPLFISGQRNSSRMGHLQPELKVMKDQLEKMGDKIDQATQLRYSQQTRALFRKYDCNPLVSILAPLASAPIFMSMFFALRNAPEHFPELLSTGGLFWFTDLTAPDPYCIMPLFSAATFLGMTEVGKEQMMASDPARGRVMVNAFRALAVVMVPMTMNFNAAVFVYWTTNNTWSFVQAMVLKQPLVKKYFGIWDPPKPVPGQPTGNLFDEIKSLTKKKEKEAPNAWAEDRIKAHNDIIEQQKLVKKKLMEKERASRVRISS